MQMIALNSSIYSLSSALGIDPYILGVLIFFCFIVTCFLFVYAITCSVIIAYISNVIGSILFGVFDIAPLWFIMICISFGFCILMWYMFHDVVYVVDDWDSFGIRLKVAYSAKYGGKNPAFNEEVDRHIATVKALGNGYTRAITMDWLKRVARMVEISFKR